MRVLCSMHSRDKVEYFCGSCQSLACMRCVVEVHGDHLELCQPVTKGDLDRYLSVIVEKLEGEKQRIAEMIGRFQALMLSKHATE